MKAKRSEDLDTASMPVAAAELQARAAALLMEVKVAAQSSHPMASLWLSTSYSIPWKERPDTQAFIINLCHGEAGASAPSKAEKHRSRHVARRDAQQGRQSRRMAVSPMGSAHEAAPPSWNWQMAAAAGSSQDGMPFEDEDSSILSEDDDSLLSMSTADGSDPLLDCLVLLKSPDLAGLANHPDADGDSFPPMLSLPGSLLQEGDDDEDDVPDASLLV